MGFANCQPWEVIRMTLREKARLAEYAARKSGEMLEHHSAHNVMRKSENDFVSEMDFKSEALIRDTLLSACPDDGFFGEEYGGTLKASGRWIVDPIDGTVNYVRGQREYTVSIAYELDGTLVIGCVYCPGTDELFLAVRGEGATKNGVPIRVSGTTVLRNALLNMGFGHRVPEHMKRTMALLPELAAGVSDIRRSGSCAYDLCSIACGRSDGYAELGLSLYDYAGGYVILTEAGGKMTGWPGEASPFDTGNLVASNGLIHDALMAFLK